jgi:NADH dehydrogenase FAD-containing subunit
MGKHLVFVGGGHAHLTALMNLSRYIDRGHSVSLVSPATHHYYSGMGPGMLGGRYQPWDIRFHIKKLAEDRGASFVQGKVVRIRPEDRVLELDSGQEVSYDVVSFNTGSSVPTPMVTESSPDIYPVKPIVNLLKARKAVPKLVAQGRPAFLVVGGGAAGLELSANLRHLIDSTGGQARLVLAAGSKLMPGFPEKVRDLALDSFTRRKVEVIEGPFVNRLENGQATFDDGSTISYDLAFPAVGVKPSPLFRDSGLPVGDAGGLLVNEKLQSVAYPEMFGGGDCVDHQGKKLDRVGVYAVRQNPVLYNNLMVALDGGDMQTFTPQDVYMLIFNMGDGAGIFVRKSLVFNGKMAFLLKNYIDQSFMKKFQVCGERRDTADYLD